MVQSELLVSECMRVMAAHLAPAADFEVGNADTWSWPNPCAVWASASAERAACGHTLLAVGRHHMLTCLCSVALSECLPTSSQYEVCMGLRVRPALPSNLGSAKVHSTKSEQPSCRPVQAIPAAANPALLALNCPDEPKQWLPLRPVQGILAEINGMSKQCGMILRFALPCRPSLPIRPPMATSTALRSWAFPVTCSLPCPGLPRR